MAFHRIFHLVGMGMQCPFCLKVRTCGRLRVMLSLYDPSHNSVGRLGCFWKISRQIILTAADEDVLIKNSQLEFLLNPCSVILELRIQAATEGSLTISPYG